MTAASLLHALRTRRMAWLLAWALCLPMAQFASAAHALLHLRAITAEHRDTGSPLPAVCDTCVLAAAIGSAAPPAALPAWTPPVLPQAHATQVAHRAPTLAPLRAYRSRAPPPRTA